MAVFPEYFLRQKDSLAGRGANLFETQIPDQRLEELCVCAKQLSAGAGSILMEIYESEEDLKTELKGDDSPVTRADRAVDTFLVKELLANTPYQVVTEESPLTAGKRKSLSTYWLIDPLDGTKNFINKDGQFSILIALIENGRPVIGIVEAPAQKEVYWASLGQGAWFATESSEPQNITHSHVERPWKVVLSSMPSTEGRAFEEAFCARNAIKQSQVSRVGSAYKLNLLARGDFDITVRFDPMGEWDIAAADCILSEAGCSMFDINKNIPVEYNARESLLMPGYLVCRADLEFFVNS